MFDMAFNQTTNMVKNQLNSYSPEAAGMWNNFKRYFQVSNQYVVGKLKVLQRLVFELVIALSFRFKILEAS